MGFIADRTFFLLLRNHPVEFRVLTHWKLGRCCVMLSPRVPHSTCCHVTPAGTRDVTIVSARAFTAKKWCTQPSFATRGMLICAILLLYCQEDCRSDISKRQSGALVKQNKVLLPKVKQLGSQVTLKLHYWNQWAGLSLEAVWKYPVITDFLKEEHKEKTTLCHKEEAAQT